MNVQAVDGHTKSYCISQGVLHGEVLSPLLFALYVSDIDKFLDNFGFDPVSLGGNNEIHCVILADNVTMAESMPGLQRKINALAE